MTSTKSSCPYTDYIDTPPRCMPYRIVNKKSPLKSQNIKDIDVSMMQKEISSVQYPTGNIFVYSDLETNEFNIRIDRKSVKDAVLVKQINLKKKQVRILKKTLRNTLQSNQRSFIQLKKIQEPKEKSKTNEENFQISGKRSSNMYRIDRILKRPQLQKQKYLTQTRNFVSTSKSEIYIHNKLISYLKFVKDIRKLHKLDDKLQQTPKKKATTICIKKGNNSNLVKELIKKRWWISIEEDKDKFLYNFVWSQLKEKEYFRRKIGQNQQILHNHFPYNEYLGNKKALLYNMAHYYKSKNKNVFNYLPLSFHVRSLCDNQWKYFKTIHADNQKNNRNNIWILKPGQNSNRGKGITIHSKLQQIEKIIQNKQQFIQTYIIQAYIERPFLYNKRKFDIRSFMLLVNINNCLKGYWYEEGYIRTSSFEFQLNDFSNFVHLTNDSIQNCSDNYGKYEDRNKISYHQFQKYLDSKYGNLNFSQQIIPKMKAIALDCILASYKQIQGSSSLPVFQIFGLDFMIDENFKLWLIEVNTNPCIQTNSSIIMEKIIPKMVDQALKLSFDILFPPPQIWPNSKKHHISSPSKGFELIFDEDRLKMPQNISLPSYSSMGLITEDDQTFQEK